MKKLALALLLTTFCMPLTTFAMTRFADGSILLTPEEVANVERNFNEMKETIDQAVEVIEAQQKENEALKKPGEVCLMLSVFFAKYRQVLLAVAFVAAFVAGMGLMRLIKNAEIAEMKEAQAKANLRFEQDARAKEKEHITQLKEAQDALVKSQDTIRSLSAANAAVTNSLRDTTNTINSRLPSLAADALRDIARTYGDIFGECQARRGELAEEAERLNAEKRALMEGWPK